MPTESTSGSPTEAGDEVWGPEWHERGDFPVMGPPLTNQRREVVTLNCRPVHLLVTGSVASTKEFTTVERYRTLMKEAEARFKSLGLTNIITRFGDGGEGWPEQAPFDRIMVTAAAPGEPKALLSQLKPNGVLVAPIGKGPVQVLRRYTGDGQGGFAVEDLIDVRFVPLLDGVAKEL